MNFLSSLVSLIYVTVFKARERAFGFQVQYTTLPSAYSYTKFPVMLDPWWFRKGFLGRGVFHVPKGNPNSARYDEHSSLFQSWVGSYFLFFWILPKFRDEVEMVQRLSLAAIGDQRAWLHMFHAPVEKVSLNIGSIRKVKSLNSGKYESVIYYGEMRSGVEDASINHRNPWQVKLLPWITAYYNRSGQDRAMTMDSQRSKVTEIDLAGYFRFTWLSNRKVIINYCCGQKRNWTLIEPELYKTIEKVELSAR